LDRELVDRFRRLVLETDARIVLSTFWRHFQDYISYTLERHGIEGRRVIGATPGFNRSMVGRTAIDKQEYSSRAQEIRAWLEENPRYQSSFLILDDRPSASDDTPFMNRRFVQSQTHLGLTEEDVDRAILILKGA
jgi:hypothetical protein